MAVKEDEGNLIKYHIFTNGCEATLFDVEKTQQQLINKMGLIKTDEHDIADIVIFYPCTFTNTNEEASAKLVREIESKFQKAKKIFVTGCFLSKETESEKIIYTKQKDLFLTIQQFVDKNKNFVKSHNMHRPNIPFIGISRGCYGNCTFCSILSVKGKHISRPTKEILADIGQLVEQYHTVKLVGDEVAGFGMDIGSSLEGLVETIFKTFPDLNLELGQLNPNILYKWTLGQYEFLENKRILGNILLPIQSASNRVLKLMNRYYTFSEYCDVYETMVGLRGFDISTDIIVGFPSESEIDHENNILFLKKYPFKFIEIFAFDKKDRQTKAGKQLDQVKLEIKEQRVRELIRQYIESYERKFGNTPNSNNIVNTNISF